MSPICPNCQSTEVQYLKRSDVYQCAECEHRFSPEAPGQRKFIFLSYGHDEHVAVVKQLKLDLESQGHTVWFDEQRLVSGKDWERSIEQGLEMAAARDGLVVFVMTPHSTRRPDGFCLNELAMALGKRLDICPVMLVWCEPPLSICRIQWLNMQDCLPLPERQERYAASFERLRQAVEHGKLDFEGAQAKLWNELAPLEFDDIIRRRTPRFVGRTWLLDRIGAWLQDPGQGRVFWLTGRPGSGKTAVAAWLCATRREIAAIHFCEHNHNRKSDPRECVVSLAYQLATQIPGYLAALAGMDLRRRLERYNAQTLFDELIVQPLSRLHPKPDRSIVVLIDAIDEASKDGDNLLAAFLAAKFFDTPEWLRLIITSRPDSEVKSPLCAYYPDAYDLEGAFEENRNDIRLYLAENLKPFLTDATSGDAAIQAIIEKSDNLFLYAVCIVGELKAMRLTLARLDEFPLGMGGYYERYFRRQFPVNADPAQSSGKDIAYFNRYCRPALEIVLAAQEALSTDDIEFILTIDKYERIAIINSFGSLLRVDAAKVTPFHRSLADWLKEECAGVYYVDVDKGHARLAETGWQAYCDAPESLPEYHAAHLPAHLIGTKGWHRLERFLSDPDIAGRHIREKHRYAALGYWRQIGDALDPAAVYAAAIERYGQAGAGPEDVARLAEGIGDLARAMPRYDAAERFYGQSLELHSARDADPDAIRRRIKLANLHRDTRRDDAALMLYTEVLASLEQKHGAAAQQLVAPTNELARLYIQQGRPFEAEEILLKAERILQSHSTASSQSTVETLLCMASAQEKQGKYEQARERYVQRRRQIEELYGQGSLAYAEACCHLAEVQTRLGVHDAAEELLGQASGLYDAILGKSHPETAAVGKRLGALRLAQCRPAEARQAYERCLALLREAFGEQHPEVAEVLGCLAATFSAEDAFEKAIVHLEAQQAICRRIYGQDHVFTLLVLEHIGDAYLAWDQAGERVDAALEAYRGLVEGRTRRLGPIHPESIRARARLRQALVRKTQAPLDPAALGEAYAATEARYVAEYQQLIVDECLGNTPPAGNFFERLLAAGLPAPQAREVNTFIRLYVEGRIFSFVYYCAFAQYRLMQLTEQWTKAGEDRVKLTFIRTVLGKPHDSEVSFSDYTKFEAECEKVYAKLGLDKYDKKTASLLAKFMDDEFCKFTIFGKHLGEHEINRLLNYLFSDLIVHSTDENIYSGTSTPGYELGMADIFSYGCHQIHILTRNIFGSPSQVHYIVSYMRGKTIVIRRGILEYVFFNKWIDTLQNNSFPLEAGDAITASEGIKYRAIRSFGVHTIGELKSIKDSFINITMENYLYQRLSSASDFTTGEDEQISPIIKRLSRLDNNIVLGTIRDASLELHYYNDDFFGPFYNSARTAVSGGDYNRALQLFLTYLSDNWFFDTNTTFMYDYCCIVFFLLLEDIRSPHSINFHALQARIPLLEAFLGEQAIAIAKIILDKMKSQTYLVDNSEKSFSEIENDARAVTRARATNTNMTGEESEEEPYDKVFGRILSRIRKFDPQKLQEPALPFSRLRDEFFAKLLQFVNIEAPDLSAQSLGELLAKRLIELGFTPPEKD